MPSTAALIPPRRFPWRLFWLLPPALLAIPVLNRWPWTLSDFIIAAVLFGVAGGTIELAARVSANRYYRGGALLAVLASFGLVWVNGAVGILGDEGNPANLMFLGVIALAAAGATIAGFRAAGMGKAMLTAGIAQFLICASGFALHLGADGWRGLFEATLGVVLFCPLWLGSSWLFARAANRPA